MDIKVQTDHLTAIQTSQVNEALSRTAAENGRDLTAPGSVADAVELSSLAKHLADGSIVEKAGSRDRVAALTALYARGEYQADAGQLSRAVIRHALGVPAGRG